jgi:peptidoglycan/LPS O-acetylase OafA/YrhL
MTVRSRIAYQPALDGVRALAVVVVLLFHAEVPGFSGGYLGVSVFFTLSGFLITSLLLAEHAEHGSISMSAFYSRRVRRLLPASLVCLGAIVLLSAVSDLFSGVAELRREIVGCLLQISNWVFLAGEGSYQQIFQGASGSRSPVEHFWSLSIEEQFYWVWPPTVALLLHRARTRRGRLIALGGLTAAFAVAAPVIAVVWGADAAYWATPARVAEILVGALLALMVAGRSVPQRLAWLAPAALVALAICIVTFPAAGGPAYEGWLPLVGAGSGALIWGLQTESPLRRLLSTRPLVWLGGISYGVYLYHWPIYLIADSQRTGLDGWRLVLLQLGITLAVAQISYVLIEQPIRRKRDAPRRATLGIGGLVTAGLVVVAIVTVPGALGEYWQTDEATVAAAAIRDDETAQQPLRVETTTSSVVPSTTATTATAPAPAAGTVDIPRPTVAATSTTTTTTTTTTTEPGLPALSRPVRIVVAGDSTANATASGLVAWAAANPDLAQVDVLAAPGCGFVGGGERLEGEWTSPPDNCDPWLAEELPGRVRTTDPDVVMLMVTTWDVLEHRWDGSDALTPLDPAFEARIVDGYRRLTDDLLAAGAGSVAWIEPPIPRIPWLEDGTGQEDPARHAVIRNVIRSLAAASPSQVGAIDLAGWLEQQGLADDGDVRPDGVHFDPAASLSIAEQFLGERLIRIAVG